MAHDDIARARERIGKATDELDLSGLDLSTGFAELIPEIANIPGLRRLRAERAGLARIGSEIARLESLETLELRDNRLISLPPALTQLRSLRRLDVRNNRITSLPVELKERPTMRIEVHGNPLSSMTRGAIMPGEPRSDSVLAGRSPQNRRADTAAEGAGLLHRHPMYVIVVILSAVLVSELVFMIFLPSLPLKSTFWLAALNALLLVGFLGIILHFLVLRPARAQLEVWRTAAELLSASERRFLEITENANEWIWEVDATGRYTYSSGAIERILGYTPDEVMQLHFYELFHPNDREELKKAALEAFARKQPFRDFLNRNQHKNGGSVWLSTSGVPVLKDGELRGYRGADTVKLDEASVTDDLTGVVNRTGFRMLGEHLIKLARRTGEAATLLFVDLDGLKEINDQLGHAEGDRAIADVPDLLRECVRDADVICRFGGDEFVVFLSGTTIESAENAVLPKIKTRVQDFNRTAGRPYRLSFSVGAAQLDPTDRVTLDELILKADAAMYEEKRRRRGR